MEVFDKFSSWHRLKKCIAWILRYKEILRMPRNSKKKILKENLKKILRMPRNSKKKILKENLLTR